MSVVNEVNNAIETLVKYKSSLEDEILNISAQIEQQKWGKDQQEELLNRQLEAYKANIDMQRKQVNDNFTNVISPLQETINIKTQELNKIVDVINSLGGNTTITVPISNVLNKKVKASKPHVSIPEEVYDFIIRQVDKASSGLSSDNIKDLLESNDFSDVNGSAAIGTLCKRGILDNINGYYQISDKHYTDKQKQIRLCIFGLLDKNRGVKFDQAAIFKHVVATRIIDNSFDGRRFRGILLGISRGQDISTVEQNGKTLFYRA